MSSLLLEKALMNASHGGKFCSKAATRCRALEGLSPSLGGEPLQVALCAPFVGVCKFCSFACLASQASGGREQWGAGCTTRLSSPVKPLLATARCAFIQILSAWLTTNWGQRLMRFFTEETTTLQSGWWYNSICFVTRIKKTSSRF